jgi:flagellin-specific chaperone FliS
MYTHIYQQLSTLSTLDNEAKLDMIRTLTRTLAEYVNNIANQKHCDDAVQKVRQATN